MRALLGGLVAALCIGLIVAAPAPAAKRRAKPSCASKGSRTIKTTRDVRVYYERDTGRDGEDVLNYFGCLKRVGDPMLLTIADEDDFAGGTSVTSVKVAGRFVALSLVTDAGCSRYQQCPQDNADGVTATVLAEDLRHARFERKVVLNDPPTAYALTQHGGLAVLANGILSARDSAGTRQLDAGAIDGRTLHAEISIVSWVRDGVERFARLR